MTVEHVICTLAHLPLGELAEALLAGPYAGVDDLEEELSGAWVENEYATIDGLRGQVALEGFVDRHAVNIGVVNEPR